MEKFSISVLILTQNRPGILLKCLQSIKNQSKQPDEIIILDNGSEAENCIRSITNDLLNKCTIQYLSHNIGCPGGRNYLFNKSKCDILIFVDDDGELEKSAIENCMKFFVEKKDIGIVTFRIIDPISGYVRDGIATNKPFYHHTFGGGSCAIRRFVFDKSGQFPEDYMRQGEEHDMALRVINLGYNILYAPNCILFHKISSTDISTGINNYLAPITTAWKYLPIHYATYRTILNALRLNKIYKNNNKIRIIYDSLKLGCKKRSPISIFKYILWLKYLYSTKKKMNKLKYDYK